MARTYNTDITHVKVIALSDIKMLVNATKLIERLHLGNDNVNEAVAALLVIAHNEMQVHMLEVFRSECRRLEAMRELLANTGYVPESEAFARACLFLERQISQ